MVVSTARRNTPGRPLITSGFSRKCHLTRFGIDSTRGSTLSTMWAAVSTILRVAQEGQMSRHL